MDFAELWWQAPTFCLVSCRAVLIYKHATLLLLLERLLLRTFVISL